MTITTQMRTDVASLYVALFGRAPLAGGLGYWVQELNNGTSLDTVAQQMYDTDAARAYYPLFLTNDEIVTSFFTNVLGRPPTAGGLAYWADKLNGGESVGQLINEMITSVVNYSGTDPAGLTSQALFENKLAVALYYAVDLNGSDSTVALNILHGVTADPASVPIAEGLGVAGADINLTSSVDTINLTGVQFDTVHGVQSWNLLIGDNAGTFNDGDTIHGNGNTLLDLVVDGGVHVVAPVAPANGVFATVTGVKEIDITSIHSDTVQAAGFSGVEKIAIIDGTNGNDILVDNLELGTLLGISNVTGTLEANFNASGAQAYASLESNHSNATSSTILFAANGDITMNLQDSASGTGGYWDGDIHAGAVTVTGGDKVYSEVWFEGTGSSSNSVSVGDVNVTLGDSSTFTLYATASNDVTIGNVNMAAGDHAKMTVWVGTSSSDIDGNVIIGDVTMVAGDDSVLYDWAWNISGDLSVGDVNLSAGDSSSVSAYLTASGNVAIGDVSLAAGNTSDVTLYAWANGTLTVGDVDLSAGDSSSVTASISSSGELTAGSITLTAGNTSDLTLNVTHHSGNSDNLTVGNVTLLAGDTSDVQMTVWGHGTGNVTVGNVTAIAGISSDVSLDVHGSGGISVGDISVLVGSSSTVDVSVSGSHSVAAGGLSIVGGDNVDAYALFSAWANMQSVTVGNIDVVVGNSSSATVTVENWNSNNLGTTVGDVSIVAGDDSQAYFFVWNHATAATTTSSTGNALGDLTVGNITVEAGNVTSISSSATASIDITNHAANGNAGDVTIGDITLSVGDGFVTAATTSEAVGKFIISDTGNTGVGDLTIGDITMHGGDFATLSLDITHLAPSGDIGAMSVGQVAITAGESAKVDVAIYHSITWSAGNAGNMTVGGVDVAVAQDATVHINVDAYAYYGTMGDLSVGDVSVLAGDNASVTIDLSSSALTSSAGAMTVGNISVAVSATDTVNSGGSYIHVSLEHYGNGSGDTFGDMTVGDISLSALDAATIHLDMYNLGTATAVGNETIGDISISAGDSSSVTITSYFSCSRDANATSIATQGDFTLHGVDVHMGDDAYLYGWMSVSNSDTGGSIGDVSFGDLTISVGDSADVYFGQYVSGSGGDVGSISFGDLNVTAGGSGSVSISQYAYVYGNIGDIHYGDQHFDFADNATDNNYHAQITATGTIGDVTVGDISVTLGDHASFSYDMTMTGEAGGGNMAVGDISLTLGTSSTVDFWIYQSSSAGALGTMTVGDVTVDVAAGASLSGWVEQSATGGDDGGMTVGNIAITANSGLVNELGFELYSTGDAGSGLTVGDVTISAHSTISVTATHTFTVTGVTMTSTTTSAVAGDVNLTFELYGSGDSTLTIGDISVDADADSIVNINVTTTGSHDVVIGDVTVSGDMPFTLDGTHVLDVTVGTGTITIGNIDYSGYALAATIDLSWTDAGGASVIGSDQDDSIVGNADDNAIAGGGGLDNMWGNGGADTFVFNSGDSGLTVLTIDVVRDWGSDDFLTFTANGAASASNYVEGAGAGSLAAVITDANNALNSTVKFFVETWGGNTFVCANDGHGNVGMIVELVGNQMANIDYTNIVA